MQNVIYQKGQTFFENICRFVFFKYTYIRIYIYIYSTSIAAYNIITAISVLKSTSKTYLKKKNVSGL